MEKMRTLLALLLKKISTPGRLKKLGFGTRLIDDVLKESISGKNKNFYSWWTSDLAGSQLMYFRSKVKKELKFEVSFLLGGHEFYEIFFSASGRTPYDDKKMSDQTRLKKNIRILLDWTIPEDYMAYFRAENKTIDEILEELAT